MKRLNALTPYGGERNLDRRIFDEILLRGLEFREDEKEKFEENCKFLGELIEIHRIFEKDDSLYPPDIFKDIFSEYMIEHNLLSQGLGQNLTPYQIVKFMVEVTFPMDVEQLRKEPQRILDPAAGTGRFMLGVASYYAEKVKCYNFVMTNIDIDKRMFTYCTMNAILHGIPSFNVHGNSLSAEVWDAFATIPLPGVRFARWIRVDPEIAKKATFPPVEPHGQQTFAEVGKVKHWPVEAEPESKRKKPEQQTLFPQNCAKRVL